MRKTKNIVQTVDEMIHYGDFTKPMTDIEKLNSETAKDPVELSKEINRELIALNETLDRILWWLKWGLSQFVPLSF